MNPLILGLSIVILYFIYYLISYYLFSKSYLAKNIHLTDSPANVTSDKIKNPNSILYTFGTWIYVNNFSNTTLFSYKVNQTDDPLFALVLGGFDDGYTDKPALRAYVRGRGMIPTQVYSPVNISNNFPIQKWVHVVVSVDTNYIDCYLDGKLVISNPFKNQLTIGPVSSPYVSFKSIKGNPSPDVYLTKLYRLDNPSDPQSVWNEYMDGNGEDANKKLKIDMSVNNDGTKNKFNIY